MMPHTKNFIVSDDGQIFFRPHKSAGNLTDTDVDFTFGIADFAKRIHRRYLKTIRSQQGVESGGLGLGPTHGKCCEPGLLFIRQPFHQRPEKFLLFT